jgi:hypothetical protein
MQAIPGGITMSLNSIVEAGIASALNLIRSRYEGNSDPDNDMAFHNVEHTAGVVRRTEALLRAMGASERDCQLGRLAAGFHDTVQRWEPNAAPDGRVLRKRFTRQNEIDSAAEAVDLMRRTGSGQFSEQDCDLVTQAILATIPGWDVDNKTVSQPNLTPDSPPIVRAVALADLGIPGMEGIVYIETGDNLFREENLDVARALRSCKTRGELSSEVLEGYKTRILNWCRAQAIYARGRRTRLPIEVGNLSGAARSAVEALFNRFDEAIAAADEVVRVREGLPAWEVVRLTGYVVPA